MERKPLLQSQHSDYHSFPSLHGYGHQHMESGGLTTRDAEENAARGTSRNITPAQSEVRGHSADDSAMSTEDRDKLSGAQGHYTCTTTSTNGIKIQVDVCRSNTDGSINPTAPQSCTGNEHKGSAEKEPPVVAALIRDTGMRMSLLTMIGFFVALAILLGSPVITQYTYQVYTKKVYGNVSAGIRVSKDPCVNATDNSTTDTRSQQVQDRSGDFLSQLGIIGGGLSIVVNLFLGAYSDIIGRKVALFLPLFGSFLRLCIGTVVIYWDLGLFGMYVGAAVEGLFGGFPATILGLYSYTADISQTTGGHRTLRMAFVEVSTGLGQAASNVLAGLFLQEEGFFYPSLTCTLIYLVCIILVLFLPETVPRDRKKVVSPLKTLQRMVGVYVPRDSASRRTMLLLALAAFFMVTFSFFPFNTLVSLYLMDRPFCWSSLHQGILWSASNASGHLISLCIISLLGNVVSTPIFVITAALSQIGTLTVLAVAKNDLMVYMVVAVGILSRMVFPTMRAFMSSLVPRDRQGAMFAGIAVIESICVCTSTTTFVSIYKVTMTFMKGFVFLALAAFNFVTVLLYIINTCLYRQYKKSKDVMVTIQAEVTETSNTHTGGHVQRELRD